MAEEKEKGHDPMKDLIFVVSTLGILILIWFMMGGPSHVDIRHRGIFLNPPPQVGNGASYGPQIGSSTNTNPPYHYQYQY